MINDINDFRAAMIAVGLTPPAEINDDGAIHRFVTGGKSTHKNGWYVLHTDGVAAGAFGDWREGLTHTWCAKCDNPVTPAERDMHRQRIQAAMAQREAEDAQRNKAAAERAVILWQAATPCNHHAYCTRKGITKIRVRSIDATKARRIDPSLSPELSGSLLVIPIRDISGTLQSLQFITEDGITKRPVTGSRLKACYHSIGKLNGVLIVCEGFATGASIHQCTGHGVAVAFTAGNLQAVAVELRKKYPSLKIIIAADDDHKTLGNPGLTKAANAVKAAHAVIAVPVFKRAVE